MIHTEQLLNIDRRPQLSEKTRKPPCNWVGQKEKEKEGIRAWLAPQGGSCGRKGSPTLGRFLTNGQIRLDRGGISEPKRGEQQQVCGRQNGKQPAQRVGTATLCSPT